MSAKSKTKADAVVPETIDKVAEETGAPSLLGRGIEETVWGHFKGYVRNVRNGDTGVLPAVGGLLVLMILFSSLHDKFFTDRNIANLLTQSAALITLAMALVFVLLLGEIDLSAGVTFGVAMGVFVKATQPGGLSWPVALLVALGIGLAVGTLIGFFVAKVGVPSFVVSLGLFLGLQGVILLIIGAGGTYRLIPEEIKAIQNSNMPPWAGWAMLVVVLALLAGVALWDRARRAKQGAPNGPIGVVFIKLGAIAVFGGLVVWFLNQVRGGTDEKPLQGVPIVVPIVLALLIAGTFLLDRTKFGRNLYATGGNAEGARRAGVNVTVVKWTAFMVCSSLAVIAGVFYISKVGSADAATGREIVLSGVAAAVVGGVSLFGGRGRLIYAVVGALVLSVIENGLLLLGLPAGVYLATAGGVLILAATVDALARGGGLRR